jgi:1-acyl-sn-glycerol-3-phosphate acyltransferase
MWMALYFPLSLIKVKITGKENFQQGENYIVVCNHNSFMDVPLSSPGIPGANKTIAKVEMSRIPLFGIIYKRGAVLINRKDENSRKESYQKMKDVLNMGIHMCIYPEGTRNKTDQPLKSFHDGAFRLSMETGKKIIPAIIRGTKEMLPTNKTFYFWPGKISMQFLHPIDPKAFNDLNALKEHVHKVMLDAYTSY